MAASNEKFRYHLTPSGWKRGSEKIDFSGWTHVEPPEDKLLTATFNERMSSGFSPLERSADVEKHAEDSAILSALSRYGADPHHSGPEYYGWPEFLKEIGHAPRA